MPLSSENRGILEELIDAATHSAPNFVQAFRNPSRSLGIKSEEDYVFGFLQGLILGQYITYRRAISGEISSEEVNEAAQIVSRRGKEIREAIFSAG